MTDTVPRSAPQPAAPVAHIPPAAQAPPTAAIIGVAAAAVAAIAAGTASAGQQQLNFTLKCAIARMLGVPQQICSLAACRRSRRCHRLFVADHRPFCLALLEPHQQALFDALESEVQTLDRLFHSGLLSDDHWLRVDPQQLELGLAAAEIWSLAVPFRHFGRWARRAEKAAADAGLCAPPAFKRPVRPHRARTARRKPQPISKTGKSRAEM